MKREMTFGAVAILILLASVSCAATAAGGAAEPRGRAAPPQKAEQLEPEAEPKAQQPEATRPKNVRPTDPPLQAMGKSRLAGTSLPSSGSAPKATAEQQPPSEIAFSRSAPAITETFSKTVDMLTRERARNEELQKDMERLKEQLAAKDQKLQQLQESLKTADEKVASLEEALEKWKHDVLGFRDEMRKAEEAEIEVLQRIMRLLQDFEKGKVEP